jgi:hypothetical protein
MSKTENNPIPKVKPRKQAVLRIKEEARHESAQAKIDAMSENNQLGRRALYFATGTVAVLSLVAGVSNKIDSRTNVTQVDTEQEGSELPDGVTSISADPGDGYEMLVRREAARSGLSESEITALPIQDLTSDAKDLNGGETLHPNKTYFVPDIQDKPSED